MASGYKVSPEAQAGGDDPAADGVKEKFKDGVGAKKDVQQLEDLEALQDYVRELRAGSIAATADDKYDVCNFYKRNSVFSTIAADKYFEYCTLTVIVLNALWIGYDSDNNIAPDVSHSQVGFLIVENFFCFYFTIEVLIRFSAFLVKTDGLKDFWFKFDSVLVIFMVFETWMLPLFSPGGGGGGLSNISALRLLRLARLTRMVRLMRAVPELVTLIKGMGRATSSVTATLALLIIFVYVFGLIFVMQYQDHKDKPDCHRCNELFGSVGGAMFTLFVGGTLLDDCTAVTNDIMNGPQPIMLLVWFLFVLLSSFTVLNMLIGVLCEVVTETAQSEAEKAVISQVGQSLVEVFAELDEDHSGKISREEFDVMKENEKVQQALDLLGIETRHLVALGESIFGGAPEKDGQEAKQGRFAEEKKKEEKELGFTGFLEMAVHLRPENKATVFDLIQMRKQIDDMASGLEERILEMEGALMRVALAPENVAISKMHGEVEILRNAIKERVDVLSALDVEVHETKKQLDNTKKEFKEFAAKSKSEPVAMGRNSQAKKGSSAEDQEETAAEKNSWMTFGGKAKKAKSMT